MAQAYQWLSLAVAQFDSDAVLLLDHLLGNISPADLDRGNAVPVNFRSR